MRIGYGISVANNNQRVFGSGASAFSPASISGLKLWVRSDVGLSSTSTSYVNQIVLSGAGDSTSDGTYTRTAGGFTMLTDSSTGNFIAWDENFPAWVLFDVTLGTVTYLNGDPDLAPSWSEYNGAVPAPSATNSTGTLQTATSWADQSGQGNNLSASGTGPIIDNNIINGKPALNFSAGKRMDGTDIVTAKTMYAVIKTLGSQAMQYSVIIECTGGGLYSAILGNEWGSYFEAEKSANNVIAINTSTIIASLSDDGATYSYRRDGAQVYTNTDGDGFTSRSALYIGNDASTGQPANVYVSEVIIYDNLISLENAQNLEAYLNAKYAIY
jgi:hypothetical protein